MKHTRQSTQRNEIGKRIRKIRQSIRPPISQDDLAGRLARQGVALDRSAISRIENQDRYVLDYEVIAIAKSLQVSVAELYAER